MGLTEFLVILFLVFIASYGGMCGVIYLIRHLKKYENFDFEMPLGLCVVLPILILSPFIDFFKTTSTAIYFTALSSFALIALFLASFSLKTVQKLLLLFAFAFSATYLLPDNLSLFQNGPALNTLFRITLALGLTGFMYLFSWLDRVPFLSLTTSLAFAALTVLFANMIHLIPMLLGIFALLIVAAQMGVSMCLKPFLPFKLGTYAACAIGFLWGFIGIYLAASGYPDVPVFASGYYLTECAFVFIATVITQRKLGFNTPFLIERALQTNIQIPRIFRIIFAYTVVLGLLGLWNANSTGLLFTAAAFLFLSYLTYQFFNWTTRPTFKNVLGELKGGIGEVKKEILELKEMRAQYKKQQGKQAKQTTTKQTKTRAKKQNVPTKQVKKNTSKTPAPKKGGKTARVTKTQKTKAGVSKRAHKK